MICQLWKEFKICDSGYICADNDNIYKGNYDACGHANYDLFFIWHYEFKDDAPE